MNPTIKITVNDKGNPAGKLADAELHFTEGVLAGLKLIGFAVWERRGGGRNVTFPARTYTVNGDRRTFALVRPIEDTTAQEGIRLAILAEYDAWEHNVARGKAELAALSRADVAATTGQYLATARGPVDTRSMGTAADYGSRGDAPEQTDWQF